MLKTKSIIRWVVGVAMIIGSHSNAQDIPLTVAIEIANEQGVVKIVSENTQKEFESTTINGVANFIIDSCTIIGIDNVFESNGINVYPNPAKGENVTISYAEGFENSQLHLTNILGKEIATMPLNGGSQTSINNAKGILFYSVISEGHNIDNGSLVSLSNRLNFRVQRGKDQILKSNPFTPVEDQIHIYFIDTNQIEHDLGAREVFCGDDNFFSYSLDADLYVLTVNDGAGSGSYEVGDSVFVNATDLDGFEFTYWSGNTELLEDSLSETTYLVMGAYEAEIFANYEEIILPKTIHLPLEVLGPDGYTDTIVATLEDASSADEIYLRVNNLSYDNKMKVKINDGDWIDVNNTNQDVNIHEPDKSYGGIGGGFSTIRLDINVVDSDFIDGDNVIVFEFNYGNDYYTGDVLSAGYRVIEFNILDNNGNYMVGESLFTEEDPTTWEAPIPGVQGYTDGEQLWLSANLKDAAGNNLNAKCADCHAVDGRDLKYFNYSNKSIVARSMFHSLSEEEGEKIASYIRGLDFDAPETARPWNPPYQPGPGTLDRGIFSWAAGAGLDAVLEEDADMVQQMFGSANPSDAQINAITNTKSNLDLKEIAIAIQFPDWKHWLPRVHPKDIWSDWEAQTPFLDAYVELTNKFINDNLAKDLSLIDEVEDFQEIIGRWLFSDRNLSSDADQTHWWTSRTGEPFESVMNPSYMTPERMKHNLSLWQTVKLWEMFQTYEAENKSRNVTFHADKFNWPTNLFTVFTAAAHFSGDIRGTSNFAWERDIPHNEDLVIGTYWSTAWYELQMVLSSGMRRAKGVDPSDWAYNMQHVNLLSYRSGVYEPMRLFRNIIKCWQQRDRPEAIWNNTWNMREVSPWRLYSDFEGKTGVHEKLDEYAIDLRIRLTNSMLKSWLSKVSEYSPDDWLRTSDISYGPWQYIEYEDYDPTDKLNPFGYFFTRTGAGDAIEAHAFWKMIPLFQQIGVDQEYVSGLATWANSVWTNSATDWEQWIE